MKDREKIQMLIKQAIGEWHELSTDVPLTSYIAEWLLRNGLAFVVRCKDCKHWLKDVPGCTDSVGRCEWANYMVGAAGYCVYGERKDNDSI